MVESGKFHIQNSYRIGKRTVDQSCLEQLQILWTVPTVYSSVQYAPVPFMSVEVMFGVTILMH